ncbi:crossover junction endodeoxyribonuclease RuvC [Streptomyces sp. NPDC058316]|uniref:crossover junction endodeoxyribonuclease RuvC n=1 Tax=Streptomyces sp. NPDC058316 TaxID=3346442 RepID=UPI0036E6ADDB
MTAVPGLIAPGTLSPTVDPVAVPGGLRVIGLDLSLTSTGVALPDGTTYRIKTRSETGDRRLLHIRDSIRDDLAEHRPHLAVVEDLPKHAMAAGITAKVHGAVLCELLDAGVLYAYVVPATLKAFACDNGRADKAQMAAAAYLAAGAEFADDKGGDQADAWWLRAAGHDWCGLPLFSMPQAQRDRLSKAKWPDAYAQRYVMGAAA